jgi:hypothetical protein
MNVSSDININLLDREIKHQEELEEDIDNATLENFNKIVSLEKKSEIKGGSRTKSRTRTKSKSRNKRSTKSKSRTKRR